MIQVASFSGPIPPPALLEKYNEVIPNGAERIMAMAERQSAHRELLEARVVNGNVSNQTRGSYFAFAIVLVAIVAGFELIREGRNVAGLAAIISAIGGVATVFIYTKNEQRKERNAKAGNLSLRRGK